MGHALACIPSQHQVHQPTLFFAGVVTCPSHSLSLWTPCADLLQPDPVLGVWLGCCYHLVPACQYIGYVCPLTPLLLAYKADQHWPTNSSKPAGCTQTAEHAAATLSHMQQFFTKTLSLQLLWPLRDAACDLNDTHTAPGACWPFTSHQPSHSAGASLCAGSSSALCCVDCTAADLAV